MCGIVGYLGPLNGVDVVLEGLKRLEYRGYDSAGVCFKNEHDELILYKKAGKLEVLRQFLQDKVPHSHACIGHTRWATHGEVSDVNAHPHMAHSAVDNMTMAIDENHSVAIVHNGIVENANELKKELQVQGIRFASQTDSEVFLGLMVYEFRQGANPFVALSSAFSKIRGNSAFVVIVKGSPNLWAVKRGAPLVCGMSKKNSNVLVSSDPYALVGMADKLFFPEDDVVCCLSPQMDQALNFFELNGEVSKRTITRKQEGSSEVYEKGEYEHFMLKEIHEQPQLIRGLTQYYSEGEGAKRLDRFAAKKVNQFHIVGCGTAWHAGLLIKNILEQENQIPCTVDLASEFRYRRPIIQSGDYGLFISQSGETADTIAAQTLCKEKGIKTYSIVNVEGSTLYRDCDENLLIKAGIEIGVASTKAFTLQVLTGHLLSRALLSQKKQIDIHAIQARFNLLAERIEELLNRSEAIKNIAEKIYNYKGFIFTGRGPYYPVALEGALKLKEIAYVHAEGYASGELKHGPIALIDEQMANIVIVGPELYEKTVSNLEEVRARRGVIVTLGPENDGHLQSISNFYLPLNFHDLNELSPLYVNVANQLLAYYVAKFKGTDIDRPRNLAKSVTVE